jgi:DNA-binding beta-propeller fold protein YncE
MVVNLGEVFMPGKIRHRFRITPALSAALVLLLIAAGKAHSQSGQDSLPNPYHVIENWAKLPEGRAWGSASGMSMDHRGNFWVLERCGANTCAGSSLAPVLEFDPTGQLLKSFGAEMFVFPHGLFVDRDDNIWVTDADGKDGKGHIVVKFSPNGKVLMTLGKLGIKGEGQDTFNRPSGVVIAPNGDIFVADGHGGDSNARIVKFSKDGKFIKAWGTKGTGPGEFGELHAIAIDSAGRVFVADRGNNRIQIFDQDGKFLDQWTQFGRPSGIYFDKKGMMYVPDNTDSRFPEWKKGIRIGRVKDGVVTAFIPDPDQDPAHSGTGAENVVSDSSGNVYAAEVDRKEVKKYFKQ